MTWLSDRHGSPTHLQKLSFSVEESLLPCSEVLKCGQCFCKGKYFRDKWEQRRESCWASRAMTMAIIGGSAEGGVEGDSNQVNQNTSTKNHQRSSCYVFSFSGSNPRPLSLRIFSWIGEWNQTTVNVQGTIVPSQCFCAHLLRRTCEDLREILGSKFWVWPAVTVNLSANTLLLLFLKLTLQIKSWWNIFKR